MISIIRKIFCSHHYKLVSWGDRCIIFGPTIGTYMEFVCTKCHKHKRKEFTHAMSDKGLTRYCDALDYDYPGKKTDGE